MLPPLYSQENEADPLVRARFFDPIGSAAWYVLEGGYVECSNGFRDYHVFTYVTGMFEDELGYVSLRELSAMRRRRLGVGIERDLTWTPCPLSTVKKATKAA